MKFIVREKRNQKDFDLVYRSEEYSFDIEPQQEAGAYTLMVNDLYIELDELHNLMHVWGLCPLIKTNSIQTYPTTVLNKSLQVINCGNLTSGVSLRINGAGRWCVSENSDNGWICIGDPKDDVSFIQFAPGTVLAVDEGEAIAMWLLPEIYRSGACRKFRKMKITQQLVKEKFMDVLSERTTFEEASVWASKIISKDEIGELEFEPNEDMSRLFSGITYLLGVNTEISPNKYLHTMEDIKIEFDRKFE